MGVLNVTPDSFSDGGRYTQTEAAVQAARAMCDAGAVIIDLGAESTRPNADFVPVERELQRLLPVLEALLAEGMTVSVDTRKTAVMQAAIDAGAHMINDVNALRDAAAVELLASYQQTVCLMHMQGDPKTMQDRPHYNDVLDDVCAFFEQRVQACTQAGIDTQRIILDPGIGFGKSLRDNLLLLRNIACIKQRFHLPVLIGVSRKSFLAAVTGSPVHDRDLETAAAGSMAIAYGADILRVHDVAYQARAMRIAAAIAYAGMPT